MRTDSLESSEPNRGVFPGCRVHEHAFLLPSCTGGALIQRPQYFFFPSFLLGSCSGGPSWHTWRQPYKGAGRLRTVSLESSEPNRGVFPGRGSLALFRLHACAWVGFSCACLLLLVHAGFSCAACCCWCLRMGPHRRAMLAEVRTPPSLHARPSTGFQRLWRCYMSFSTGFIRVWGSGVPGFFKSHHSA